MIPNNKIPSREQTEAWLQAQATWAGAQWQDLTANFIFYDQMLAELQRAHMYFRHVQRKMYGGMEFKVTGT